MRKYIAFIVLGVMVLVFTTLEINEDKRNERYSIKGTVRVSTKNGDKTIEPKGYIDGFSFNYDELPTIKINKNDSTLVFKFNNKDIDKILVGEDYYTFSRCYKKNYTITKNKSGYFELPVKRKVKDVDGEHGTYYIKYNLKDKGVFVFKGEFIE